MAAFIYIIKVDTNACFAKSVNNSMNIQVEAKKIRTWVLSPTKWTLSSTDGKYFYTCQMRECFFKINTASE